MSLWGQRCVLCSLWVLSACAPEPLRSFSYMENVNQLALEEPGLQSMVVHLSVIAEFDASQLPNVRVPLAAWDMPLTFELRSDTDGMMRMTGLWNSEIVVPFTGSTTVSGPTDAAIVNAILDAERGPWVDSLPHRMVLCESDLAALSESASDLEVVSRLQSQTLNVSFRSLLGYANWTAFGALRVWNPDLDNFENGQAPPPDLSAETLNGAANSKALVASFYQGQGAALMSCLKFAPIKLSLEGSMQISLHEQNATETEPDSITEGNPDVVSETPVIEPEEPSATIGGKCVYGQFACNPEFPQVVFYCARPHAQDTGAHHAVNAMPGVNPHIVWDALGCSTGEVANEGLHPLCLRDAAADNLAVCRDLLMN